MNNNISASRLNTLLTCPRKHFWNDEIRLRKIEGTTALYIGSAWARAMETRWNGGTYEECLASAIPESIELDLYSCATVAALLAGYFARYGEIERLGKLSPEVPFNRSIEGTEFTSVGYIDALGTLTDGRSVLVEMKTTGDSIDPNSDFWLRLKFNVQVLQYIVEARNLGWDLSEVLYDVTRKPSIQPKQVTDLDSEGRKIVVDRNGERVYATKKVEEVVGKGKNAKKNSREVADVSKPRQTADKAKGYVVKSHIETPDEYRDRLYSDTLARPDFYFVRKPIPIIEQDVEAFLRQRGEMVELIKHYRDREIPDGHPSGEDFPRDPEAWPRNVSCDTCDWCAYKNFCLENRSIDLKNLPEGFEIK